MSYASPAVPEHQSIFGDTHHGVPSPLVPHRHPYPTRYHGPIWTTPWFSLPYRQNPYARVPYAGLGDGNDADGLGQALARRVERARGRSLSPGAVHVPGLLKQAAMSGLGGSCGCGGMQRAGGTGAAEVDGLGQVQLAQAVGDPDGLGASAVFGSPTGMALVDAGLGALAGWATAPRESDKNTRAVVGALAGLFLGTLGIVAVGGYGLYERSRR